MSQYDIYGIGNALVDMEYRVTMDDLDHLGIEKGIMTLVDADRQTELLTYLNRHHVHRSAGGSAANTVIALTQFGGRGFFTGKVAADELGDLYARDLVRNGVDTNPGIPREPGDTGRCVVLVTPDADRTMCTYLGITGTLALPEIDCDALHRSDCLYIEGYLATAPSARLAIAHARDCAREAGIKTAISLSDPAIATQFRGELCEMIGPGVDLLFANEAEAKAISEADDLEDVVRWLRGIAREFVITRGPEGALIWNGHESIEVAACEVAPIDTLGAGDMFAGAFLYGLSQGWDHRAAATLAHRATSHLITAYGPRLETTRVQAILSEYRQSPS